MIRAWCWISVIWDYFQYLGNQNRNACLINLPNIQYSVTTLTEVRCCFHDPKFERQFSGTNGPILNILKLIISIGFIKQSQINFLHTNICCSTIPATIYWTQPHNKLCYAEEASLRLDRHFMCTMAAVSHGLTSIKYCPEESHIAH